jgi:hypothetical protein
MPTIMIIIAISVPMTVISNISFKIIQEIILTTAKAINDLIDGKVERIMDIASEIFLSFFFM